MVLCSTKEKVLDTLLDSVLTIDTQNNVSNLGVEKQKFPKWN